ncbi:MAG: hypothetical protein AB1489_38040 [Acidobacteriota bacterium]
MISEQSNNSTQQPTVSIQNDSLGRMFICVEYNSFNILLGITNNLNAATINAFTAVHCLHSAQQLAFS